MPPSHATPSTTPSHTNDSSAPEPMSSYGAIGLHHAAIIMDGNRRWAKQRHLPTLAGHKAGLDSLKRLIEHLGPHELDVLTIYAFSTENWQRQEQEVAGLMQLFAQALVDELKPLHQQQVQVRFIGDTTTFSGPLKSAMDSMTETTANNTGLILNVAMNYGGRNEILRAAQKAWSPELNPNGPQPFTEAVLSAQLDTGDCPSPDLVIRTGGEQRLSNFLLWQAAYAELMFVDALWPDFTPALFMGCAQHFAQRHRRYGT